jgi:hypothetical protein
MATNDKNDLLIQIETHINDNTAGEISPADLRIVLSAMVTADLNLEELAQQIASGVTFFKAAGLTPQLIDPPNQEGTIWYDNVNKTLAYYNNLGKQLFGSKKSFIVATTDSIPISSDPDASSFFTGLTAINGIDGFEINVASGSVRNVSGKTLNAMSGTISTQPSKTGGTTTELDLFSERSTDLVNWTKNANSARSYQITNTGQSFRTTVSFIESWANNEYVRFKFFAGDNTLSFEPTSIIADGDTVNSYSAVWALTEV